MLSYGTEIENNIRLYCNKEVQRLVRDKDKEDIMPLLQVNNIKKIYTQRFSRQQYVALNNVNFKVEEGEFVAIMGPSGAGKTTLLNILASLDRVTSGEVLLDGRDMGSIKESELASFRRNNLGFVFQDFNLLDTFTLKDNIFLPLVLSQENYEEMSAKLEPIARTLDIADILEKYPYEVSGGQKQRCAVARAIITKPKILLADEPTGALDSKSSNNLLNMFESINRSGQTIVMVTHSSYAASYANRVMFIKDGEVYSEIYKGDRTRKEFLDKVVSNLLVMSDGGVSIG